MVLAPWVIHSTYSMLVKDKNERDVGTFLILPLLLWRMVHNQIWITLSRYRTAKGNGRIVDKGLEFDQVDREREWLVSFFHTLIPIFIPIFGAWLSALFIHGFYMFSHKEKTDLV